LTTGKHHLAFSFGGSTLTAHNMALRFNRSKRLGGSSSDSGNDIAVDSNNNFIITGFINGTADLTGDADTGDANETGGGVYGNNDIFISVFDSVGTYQWSKRLGGANDDHGSDVAVDTNDNIIVVGRINDAADLDGDGATGGANETGGGVYGLNDIFVTVFDSSGVHQWSKRLGGANDDYGSGVAVDSNNNIIVVGRVNDAADLDGDGATGGANESGGGVYGKFFFGRAWFQPINCLCHCLDMRRC